MTASIDTLVPIAVSHGFIGGVLMAADSDMSRLDETTEMVIYILGNRRKAFDTNSQLKRIADLRISDVDAFLAPACVVTLGEGVVPHTNRYPIKVRVPAPHGFSRPPATAFDQAAVLIRLGRWSETPDLRSGPRPSTPASERESDAGDGGHREPSKAAQWLKGTHKRLGAARRIASPRERAYTAPNFKVPVQGYDRRIHPESWGKDKDGNPTKGMTTVRKHARHKNKPPRSDAGAQAGPVPAPAF